MKRYQNEEWLRQKYVEEKLSQEEIGKLEGVGGSTISYWMQKFNMTTKTGEQIHRHRKADITYRNRSWLRRQYLTLGKSVRQIAAKCGVSHNTVWLWIKRYKIRRTVGK